MNTQTKTRGQTTRFDPAEFAPQDLESVHELMEFFLHETRPPARVDDKGQRLELPKPIYELLVKLIEEGKLPSHKVGAHRRIQMKDLQAFQRVRDNARREALDELARLAQEAGLY